MKKLLIYLSGYKKECVLAPLFKMFEACFELTVPLVIASLVDVGIKGSGTGDRSHVIKCFIILIVLGLVGLLCATVAQFFAARAATGFATVLRHDLFKHLLNLKFRDLDDLGTSTMITRMTSDVNTVQNGVNMFLRLFLRSPFIVLGAMVMAFTIDVPSALIFLGVIIVLGLVVLFIMRSNIAMLKTVQKALDKVLTLVRENLSGARVIRAFTIEDREYEKFEESTEKLSVLQRRAGALSGLLNPLTYSVINIAIVVLIFVSGIRVGNGALSTGSVVALYNYMSQILVELIKFAGLVVSINKALAGAGRISEVLDIPEDDTLYNGRELDKDIESVEFQDVSLRYHENSDEALSNISFRAEKGQTIGIIGSTGSGKSTLVNLVAGFYTPTDGKVLINGQDMSTFSASSIRKRIAVVMQKAVLFNGTIKENLEFGKEGATDEEIEKALKLACADEVVETKGGNASLVEALGKNFSGGQRQRLTIARALLMDSDILILDDASSALDYATDLKLRTNLKTVCSDRIVFIVSQRTSAVRNSDMILVLDDGELVAGGTHEELMEKCGVYREIDSLSVKDKASVENPGGGRLSSGEVK